MAQQIITLARDADLETLPNGGEQIFWSDPATWGWCAGAAGVRMQALVLSTTPNTFASIVGQYSNDGRSWSDFEKTIDGDSTPQALTPTNGQLSVRQYAGSPWEMAPYVRFGIRVSRTGNLQGRVRLSCDLIVLQQLDAARLMIAGGATVSATDSVLDGDGQLGEIENTYCYDRGSFYIRNTAYTGTESSITLVVETTFFMNEQVLEEFEHWRTVTTVPSLTTFTAEDQYQNVEVSGLDAYTRVRVVGATGTVSATFSIYAFLRPAN